MRQVLVDTDAAAMQEDVRRFDAAEADFRRELDAAEKTIVTPEAKAKLAEVRGSYPSRRCNVRVRSRRASRARSARSPPRRIASASRRTTRATSSSAATAGCR